MLIPTLIDHSATASWSFIQLSLGLQAETLTAGQMILRAVVVYALLIVLIRAIGDRRFCGQHAAIDVILSIILGATLSRAINGSAAFFSTLIVGIALVVIHWVLALLTFRFSALERLLKGQSMTLIRNGEPDRQNLRRSHVTANDLATVLRLQGEPIDFERIAQAALETDGSISLKTKSRGDRILEVAVESGVQTIRIELKS